MDEDGKKFGNEEFLSRWSRLKQQARDEPPAEPQPASLAKKPRRFQYLIALIWNPAFFTFSESSFH